MGGCGGVEITDFKEFLLLGEGVVVQIERTDFHIKVVSTLGEGVVVLKELKQFPLWGRVGGNNTFQLFGNSFSLWGGFQVVYPQELILTASTSGGGCGGVERTDF